MKNKQIKHSIQQCYNSPGVTISIVTLARNIAIKTNKDPEFTQIRVNNNNNIIIISSSSSITNAVAQNTAYGPSRPKMSVG